MEVSHDDHTIHNDSEISPQSQVADATKASAATRTTITSSPTTRILDHARIDILPFGVALTQSELRTNWDKEPSDDILLPTSSSSSLQVGVVGTITMLQNAAMIWFGWGLTSTTTDTMMISREGDDQSQLLGNGTTVHGHNRSVYAFFSSMCIHASPFLNVIVCRFIAHKNTNLFLSLYQFPTIT